MRTSLRRTIRTSRDRLDRRVQPGSIPSDRGVGRLSLTRTQAAAIVRRGWDLVQAGPTDLCPVRASHRSRRSFVPADQRPPPPGP